MKKITVVLLICAMAICVSLVSCGGGGLSGAKSPSDIEKGLWELMQKGKFEKAIDYWFDNMVDDESQKEQNAQMKTASKTLAEKMKQSVEEKGGIKDFKIEKEEISEDGLSAKVYVSVTYGNGSDDEEVKKYFNVDGKWKMDNSMK
jgi:hypothetical protein